MSNKYIVLANAGILFIAVSWRLSFSVIKWALSDITPLYYLTMRFLLSGILLAVIFFRLVCKMKKSEVYCGIFSGIFLAASFTAQTVGLQYTTPGKAGFLANACVVIVPFLIWLFYKKRPEKNALVGAFIAFAGLAVMSLTESFTIQLGDFLQLMCALCFAGQMMVIDRYAENVDPVRMSVVQVISAGLITLIFALILEPVPDLSAGSFPVAVAVGYGVIFCTALSFVIQGYAQKVIKPSNVSIILCFEAVFAFVFAIGFGYEQVTFRNVAGSVMVIGGFMISQISLKQPYGKELN